MREPGSTVKEDIGRYRVKFFSIVDLCVETAARF